MIPGKGRLQKHPVDLVKIALLEPCIQLEIMYTYFINACRGGSRILQLGGGAFTTGGAFAMMGLDVC